MSSTQEVRQVQDQQMAVSGDDLAIMDYTEPEKDPESGAEEAGAQANLDRCRWGRCRRRTFMRRQMEMENDECHYRSHHREKRRMAMRWMKKMMWRRMMFRMCYGGPFGMGAGAGFGCRRRMGMIAATMMDSSDTSSSDSGDRQEHGAGWRHRRCCRGKKFGRRFGDPKRLEDQATEKGKDLDAEAQAGNAEESNQNTLPPSTSKDGVTAQTISTQNVESAASGRIHDRKGRRKEHKKWKCMRRGRYCDMLSDDSSSDSSSSESSTDENEPAHEVSKSKKHCGRRWRRGGRHHQELEENAEGNKDENEPAHEVTKPNEYCRRRWRRGGRHHHHQEQTIAEGDENEAADEVNKSKEQGGCHWRRGGRHHHHQKTNAEGNGDEKSEKCTTGRRAWKGRRSHKKMMKGMGRRGYFRCF